MSTTDSETGEIFYPVQSMTLNNEWKDSKDDLNPPTLSSPTISNNGHPQSPYFQTPKINENDKVRFISPLLESNREPESKTIETEISKIDQSILNELLPTQVQLNSSSTGETATEGFKGKLLQYFENDAFFGQAFKISLISWSLFAFYLITFKQNSSALNPSNDKLSETVGWFICLLGIGLGVSLVWAKLLAEQTEVVIYGLVLSLPAGFAFLALLAFSHWFIILGLILGIVSLFLIGAIWFNRRNYQTTIEIVRTSAIFVQATPKVYTLLFKIVVLYAIFVVVWLIAFRRLFGALDGVSFTIASVLQVCFLFILLWTGAVLSTAQKFIIAKWVRSWMNQTEDYEIQEERSTKLDESSFGSICLAAGILTTAKIIRLVSKSLHFAMKSMKTIIPNSAGILTDFFGWLISSMSVAEAFIQKFTDFSIYFMAVDGTKGFMTSSRALGGVLDGHWGLAITTDGTAQLILSFSTALIGLTSTALVFLVSKARISWSSSIFIGLLAVSVTDFVSTIFSAAIDASFLCYLMDLKDPSRIGKMNPKIQSAFATKLEESSV